MKQTKFLSLDTTKVGTKTIFTHVLTIQKELNEAQCTPEIYDNVLWLGFDNSYGDVFKAWDNNDTNFYIYFGKKGTEFD